LFTLQYKDQGIGGIANKEKSRAIRLVNNKSEQRGSFLQKVRSDP
jgi:hypothetical protein